MSKKYQGNFSADGSKDYIILGSHIRVSRALYDNTYCLCPMVASSRIMHCGKTSFDFQIQLRLRETHELLVSVVWKAVCIDAVTGQQADLPQQFVNRKKHVKEEDYFTYPKFERLSIPGQTFTEEVLVLHSDMDYIEHVTSNVFLMYAENCAASATKAGHYRYFREDIVHYQLELAHVLHTGQSRAGDRLVVHTWQHPTQDTTLYCVITKQGSDIFQARLDYYDTPPLAAKM